MCPTTSKTNICTFSMSESEVPLSLGLTVPSVTSKLIMHMHYYHSIYVLVVAARVSCASTTNVFISKCWEPAVSK